MERDTALSQLNEMRSEILAIYADSEKCKEIQEKTEKLLNEKKNPVKPEPDLLCENTEQKLKEKFLRENKENTLKSKKGNIIILLISAAIILAFSCLLFCDLIFNANIFLNSRKFSGAADFTDKIVLFVMHFVLSIFCVILPAVKKPIKKPVIVLFLIAAIIFAVFYIGLIYGFSAWIYPVVTAVCFALTFTATRIIDSLKNKRAPKLSQSQISELKTAAEKDIKAKAKNAETRARVQAEWEKNLKIRNSEIDSELSALKEEYSACRKELDVHFAALKQIDYLCEDDKNLQTIDMLIRFIETRRADSIKEALQEYDKLLVNKQMLELEKQKVEAELNRAALEHDDRIKKMEAEERHNFEMRCIAADNARARENIARQLDSIGNTIYYDLRY